MSYKIAILGIGGVGGYLGGYLARSIAADTEVYFVARGEHLKTIAAVGLELSTTGGDFTAHPTLVTDEPLVIGHIDLLICAVKNYDLEESLRPFSEVIDERSVILPFLNGVSSASRIQQIFPSASVWGGCIYITSRLTGPGKIRQTGSLMQIIIGSNRHDNDALAFVKELFGRAGVPVTIADDIDQQLWVKYVFISALATITSYYHDTMAAISSRPERLELLRQMTREMTGIAAAIPVALPAGLAEEVYDRISALPPATDSSMSSDFKFGHRTEVEELTGNVVRLGAQYHVPTPVYQLMYESLKSVVKDR